MTDKPRIKDLPEGSVEYGRDFAEHLIDSIDLALYNFRSDFDRSGTTAYEKRLAKWRKACVALLAMPYEDVVGVSKEALLKMLQPDKGEDDGL